MFQTRGEYDTNAMSSPLSTPPNELISETEGQRTIDFYKSNRDSCLSRDKIILSAAAIETMDDLSDVGRNMQSTYLNTLKVQELLVDENVRANNRTIKQRSTVSFVRPNQKRAILS